MEVYAEEYLRNPGKYKKYSEMGISIDPVDCNGGLVITDKLAKDNLPKTEENIRERFGLDVEEESDTDSY